ncbi:MAG TPA: helix-hairpin-helix domain-containing protein [Lacipirellula sp.]
MVRAAEKRNNSKTARAAVVSNEQIADTLTEIADLLERQGANPYRVRAYRQGAETVRHAEQPLQRILAERGVRGLMKLRGIGDSLANAIEKIIHSKKLPLLTRLRGGGAPERLFSTVADIGPKLAARIHDELGISTLSELEAACWDGRLARVPGMGQKRIRAVRESLAGRFNRGAERPEGVSPPAPPEEQPPVEELLDIDRQYRDLAERDRLMRIAPRRFNPEGRAWLPILHAERDGRQYTAMYSNTSRAHELGTLRDWVVIYREDKKLGGTWTVITARLGPLKGKRVVRGREAECAAWYEQERTCSPNGA